LPTLPATAMMTGFFCRKYACARFLTKPAVLRVMKELTALPV
jgi:hypothetical protein